MWPTAFVLCLPESLLIPDKRGLHMETQSGELAWADADLA
jgi:hypothetical protein